MTFMPELRATPGLPRRLRTTCRSPVARLRRAGVRIARIRRRRSTPSSREIGARLAWLPLGEFRHDPARDRDYEVAAHWALYVENYLEGFHIPFVHPALNQVLDMQQLRLPARTLLSLQLALAREGDAAFEPPPARPDPGRRVAAYYWWVFPNLMLNFYPWGLR